MNRRTFFERLVVLAGATSVLGWNSVASAERKRGGGGDAKVDAIKIVDPNSPAAKGLQYTENKATIKDATLKVERQGVAFEKQNCANCGFYSNPTKHNGQAVGACQIFPGQHVKANAWCQTWNKKA
jgi:hypothetical protein